MSYVAEIIARECPECQAERVATILIRNGITNPTVEYHYEIFTYFKRKLEQYANCKKPIREATLDTLDYFNISRFLLLRIRKQF